MTKSTHRNNIKPMLLGIAGMMVVVCLFAAGAFHRVNRLHLSRSDSVSNSVFCFNTIRELGGIFSTNTSGRRLATISLPVCFMGSLGLICFLVLFLHIFALRTLPMASLGNLTLCAVSMAHVGCFALFAVIVRFAARFALPVNPIFGCAIFVKFRYLLSCLAFRALLWYDGFGHGLFLLKKLCLEPIAAQTVVGSLYCSTLLGGVK